MEARASRAEHGGDRLGGRIAGGDAVPGLAEAQNAKELGVASLVADSKETFVCSYMSFALRLGLGLNALLGWWRTDPVAALLMVPVIEHKGWEAVRGAENAAM